MYFDPGIGSIIIQTLLAVIATIGVVWGVFKLKVKGLLAKKKEKDQTSTKEDQL